MELAPCVGAGLASGFIAGFLAAIVQLTAKRARNAALARRNEPQPRDLVLIRWWWPLAIAGALAGLGVGLAGYAWPIAALAGAALPALLVVVAVVVALGQAVRG